MVLLVEAGQHDGDVELGRRRGAVGAALDAQPALGVGARGGAVEGQRHGCRGYGVRPREPGPAACACGAASGVGQQVPAADEQVDLVHEERRDLVAADRSPAPYVVAAERRR